MEMYFTAVVDDFNLSLIDFFYLFIAIKLLELDVHCHHKIVKFLYTLLTMLNLIKYIHAGCVARQLKYIQSCQCTTFLYFLSNRKMLLMKK